MAYFYTFMSGLFFGAAGAFLIASLLRYATRPVKYTYAPTPTTAVEPPRLSPIQARAQQLATLKHEFDEAMRQYPGQTVELQLAYDEERRKILES